MNSFWDRFRKEEKGATLVTVAILMVVLLGFTAVAVDVGAMYLTRRQMVNAADAAALAGAMAHNPTHTKNSAKEYGELNGADPIDRNNDVVIDSRGIVTVRVEKKIDFTFARIFNINDTVIRAVASAQQGPGNGLVPFTKVVHECECEDCEDEIRIIDYEGNCVKEQGQIIQLKHDRWQKSELYSGCFGYVRLPGQSGGNDLRNDIGGGYEGDLDEIEVGVQLRIETGQSIGPLVQALEDRLNAASETYCTEEDELVKFFKRTEQDMYECPLVVVIPLVATRATIPSLPNNYVQIVGYASLLLELVEVDNEKEVFAYFIEYLEYDDLVRIYGPKVEGFVIRLVPVPRNVF